MEDKDFTKEEKEIERLNFIIKSIKHIRLCFIDLIDQGAKITRDDYSVKIEIINDKPSDYRLLAEYYSKQSIIYDSIIESIDKVNLEFKPVSETVISEDNKITIQIVVYKKEEKTFYSSDYRDKIRIMPNSNEYFERNRYSKQYYIDNDYKRSSYNKYGDLWSLD